MHVYIAVKDVLISLALTVSFLRMDVGKKISALFQGFFQDPVKMQTTGPSRPKGYRGYRAS